MTRDSTRQTKPWKMTDVPLQDKLKAGQYDIVFNFSII